MMPRRKETIFDSGVYEESILDDTGSLLRQLDKAWNPPPNPYINDPIKWINDIMGEFLWSKIKEVCSSVVDHRFTAVRSCHGVGKSYIASRLAAWWITTREDPFVVTTAPTAHQVKTILWRYIKSAKKKGDLKGRITEGQVPEWKIDNELVAFGRKPADYLDPTEAAAAFQGIHALNVLVIIDEASGIPEWLANAVETLITNERSRVLAVGNPDNPTSWFAKMSKPGSGYNRIKIAWQDTPNYTGEYIPDYLKDLLVSRIWVEERAKRWGIHSPLYVSKVLAEFPDISDDTLFTPAILAIGLAVDRSSRAVNVVGNGGMDVARYGSDETVLYLNREGYIRLHDRWSKMDTMESVGRFRRLWQENVDLAPSTQIDVNGLGSGVFDRLKELHYPVIPFNGGERAYKRERYRNRRAEAYWEAKEAMESGLVDIEELDEDLQAELLEIKFKNTSTGLIQIEDKDDIRKRLGRSPDRADAFVMSLQKRADWAKALQLTVTDQTASQPSREEEEDLVADLMEIEL